MQCIQELEGLQLYCAESEQVFVLQPNVLHACMCIATSAHIGTWVWMYENLNKSMELVRWGINWVKSRSGEVGSAEVMVEEIKTLELEIDAWKEFVEINKGDEHYEEAAQLIGLMAKEILELKALYKPEKGTKQKWRKRIFCSIASKPRGFP